MTWFDRSNVARPLPAVFSDRSSSVRNAPSWMEEKTDLNEQSGVFEALTPVLRPVVQAVHEVPKEVFPEPEPESIPEPLSERMPPVNALKPMRLSERPAPITMPAAAPVDDHLMARREAAIAELEQAVSQFSAIRENALRESESQLVMLAAQIAKRVIGRELSVDPSILAALAVEGVTALAERDRIRIRVGSMLDDDTMRECTERLQNLTQSCQIAYDPSLSAGGCLVESDLGFVDESIDSRLASIMRALLPTPDPTGRIE